MTTSETEEIEEWIAHLRQNLKQAEWDRDRHLSLRRQAEAQCTRAQREREQWKSRYKQLLRIMENRLTKSISKMLEELHVEATELLSDDPRGGMYGGPPPKEEQQ